MDGRIFLVGLLMNHRNVIVAVSAAMVCLVGLLADSKLSIGLLMIGLVALIILGLTLSLTFIVNLVIIASFLSRIAIPVFGFHVRPEYLASFLIFIKILSSNHRDYGGRAGSRAILAMTFVVLLNLVATITSSPDPKMSLDIVGWLFIDLVLLWSLLHVPEAMLRRAVLRTGLFCALTMGIAAIIFWLIAEAGGPLIAVQPDTAYGGYAAYVGSYEANIAAGILVLWALIALASLVSGRQVTWVTRLAAMVCPIALIATDTRAAILAYFLGAAILASRGHVLRMRHVVVGAAIVILGVVALSLGSQFGSIDHTVSKLTDYSLTSGDGGLRLQSLSTALHDMSDEQIVLGLGTNSFGQRHLDPTLPQERVPGYLGILPIQVVYDAGGIALLCVIMILVVSLPERRYARSLAYSMAFAYLVISTATSPFWFSFTWIFIALGVLQSKNGENAPLDRLSRLVGDGVPRGHQYLQLSKQDYLGEASAPIYPYAHIGGLRRGP